MVQPPGFTQRQKSGQIRHITMSKRHTFEDLVSIMRALRDPENGCPWDLEQDFKSISPYTLEEAYEVADAIETENMEDLREELGDLLLQPIYHAQMATEQSLFTIDDVIHDIAAKMIDRHPHVFGDRKADSASDVNKIWDEKKAAKNAGGTLGGVAKALPALLRAQKLQKKAAKKGFEWPGTPGVLNKLHEELNELDQAIQNKDQDNIEEEIGDVIFLLANFARMHNVDAETSLRRCNDKFVKRFEGMESDIQSQNKTFEETSLDELLALWSQQKLKSAL